MDLKDSNNFDQYLSSYKEGFQPDPEAGLVRLNARLGQHAQLEQTIVRPLAPRRWLALAATLLLLVTVAFFVLRADGSTSFTNDTNTPMAVSLPDGTEVLLQQGGALSYPATYNEQDRRVALAGQAYFEVYKDDGRPFLVNTSATELRVTGTAFNLRVNDQELEVEVSEGSVELRHDGEVVPITALQCGLAQIGKKCTIMPAENLNRHAWRTGTLRFDSVPLPVALKTISNNYGFDISYPTACGFPIAGTFAADNPLAVLSTIAELDGGKLRKDEDGSFHFIDMSCGE